MVSKITRHPKTRGTVWEIKAVWGGEGQAEIAAQKAGGCGHQGFGKNREVKWDNSTGKK